MTGTKHTNFDFCESLPETGGEERVSTPRPRCGASCILQPTALVHEAWLRLGGDGQRFENRAHFFGAAAEPMDGFLPRRAARA